MIEIDLSAPNGRCEDCDEPKEEHYFKKCDDCFEEWKAELYEEVKDAAESYYNHRDY